MSSQIKFFNKNKIDLSNDLVVLTVTDSVASNTGQSFVDFIRNRNNFSAWLTTGSNDSANTELLVDMVDGRELTEILLIGHNFKAYTIQYWNGSIFTDFSTPISETVNTETTNHHTFDLVSTSMVKIIITLTQVVDADKQLKQLILTDRVLTGQFIFWPLIKKPKHNTNKKVNLMLSGKVNVVESIGGFSMDLSISNWTKTTDLDIVEEIYFGKRGVLVWLGGGDEAQFAQQRIGYRKEDIFFMRAINDYIPEWRSGIYVNGLKITMKMREAIN